MTYNWTTLPPAVAGLILNHVAREAALDHTLARYAAVNRDWQYFFEQTTFRSLNLGHDDLPEFETMVSIYSDRRKWLRALSFHVVDCDCAHLDHKTARPPPEHKVSRAVASLLRLLKKWDADASLRLALCLSAPTARSRGSERVTRFRRKYDALPFADSLHQPEKHGLDHIVGKVPAIKSFSIRYRDEQTIRSRAIIDLCSQLPELEELCLQDVHHQNEHTKHFQIANLTPEFPTTLKRLHVLGQGGKDSQGTCRFLVQRLVWFGMTTRLQELSITTSGNAAEEFFENLRDLARGSSNGRTYQWPALQSLTLTCSLLKPGTPHAAVNRLLHQAGMAALDLPRLRELRLLSYNTRKRGEVDGSFRYVANGQEKDVTSCFDIVASEHIHMGRLVMDTWRNAAWESHRALLRFSSSAHSQSDLLTLEDVFGEHGRSAFETIQYPRPHWTASEGLWNLLGAFLFFVALVSILSLLVNHQKCRFGGMGVV